MNGMAELRAICILITLALEIGFDQLQVIRDFMVVIKWMNRKSEGKNLDLFKMLHETLALKQRFQWISFNHTRENNAQSN